MIIVHAALKNEWESCKGKNTYEPKMFESLKKDGFIHCCELENIVDVANDNLKKIKDPMVLLCIDTDKLTAAIKWEERGDKGIKFPHVYGPINIDSVIDSFDFNKDENGNFAFPDEILKYVNYEKSCGAIIFHKFNNDEKVLLINHVNGKHWAFPKGHVEGKETEKETAVREVLEETGFQVDVDTNFRYTIRYSPMKGVIKDVIYFIGHVKKTEYKIQVEEVNNAKWCTVDEAKKLITFENNLRAFNAAFEYIKT